MAAINVLVVAALVGVDFVAVSEEGARPWHTTLPSLGRAMAPGRYRGPYLRRRIRTFIDEAEHVVRHEQIRRVKWRQNRRWSRALFYTDEPEEHFAYGAGKQRSPTRRDWKRSRGAWSAGLSGAVRNRAASALSWRRRVPLG